MNPVDTLEQIKTDTPILYNYDTFPRTKIRSGERTPYISQTN